MALPPSANLRLFASTQILPAEPADWRPLLTVCNAFEPATGWTLQLVAADPDPNNTQLVWSAPVSPGVGTAPGHLRLGILPSSAADAAPLGVKSLADSIAALWSELAATRRALWEREAELAASVPLAVRAEPAESLATRLEAVLRAGALAVDSHAAALYLLDAGTTELKLRASWGLPHARLADRARPLKGALADLEALLGQAVALPDRQLHSYWRPPEDCGAAVCVPVLGSSEPLGTLWVFSRHPREYLDRDTNLLEVIAGRISCELERQVLADASLASSRLRRELGACAGGCVSPAPPLVSGWDIAGQVARPTDDAESSPQAAFFDWFAGEGGRLHVVAGAAQSGGPWGALTAATLRGALRASAAGVGESAQPLLETANDVLWATSAGDARASAAHLLVAPGGRTCQWSAAGGARFFVVRPGEKCHDLTKTSAVPNSATSVAKRRRSTREDGDRATAVLGQRREPLPPLGASHDLTPLAQSCDVYLGDVLVALVGGHATDRSAAVADSLTKIVAAHRTAKSRELAALIADSVNNAARDQSADAAVVVLRSIGR